MHFISLCHLLPLNLRMDWCPLTFAFRGATGEVTLKDRNNRDSADAYFMLRAIV